MKTCSRGTFSCVVLVATRVARLYMSLAGFQEEDRQTHLSRPSLDKHPGPAGGCWMEVQVQVGTAKNGETEIKAPLRFQ